MTVLPSIRLSLGQSIPHWMYFRSKNSPRRSTEMIPVNIMPEKKSSTMSSASTDSASTRPVLADILTTLKKKNYMASNVDPKDDWSLSGNPSFKQDIFALRRKESFSRRFKFQIFEYIPFCCLSFFDKWFSFLFFFL